jgi:ribosomal protein S7
MAQKNISFFEFYSKNSLFKNKELKKTVNDKFINLLMIDGEKTKAFKLFYKTIYLLQKKLVLTKKTKETLTELVEKINKNQKIKIKKNKNLKLDLTLKFSINKSFINSLKKIDLKKSFEYDLNQDLNCYSSEDLTNSSKFSTPLYSIIQNVKPSIEVRKVRVARNRYQVPAIIPKKRQETLAIRWIIESGRKRKQNTNKEFSECLAQEFVDSFNKQGQARQKRDDLHKTAESNRAFLRYRWW